MQTNIKQKSGWQQILSNLITDPRELWAELGLDDALLPAALEATKLFPLRVTRSYLNRMRKHDPRDPLLRQVLPVSEEMVKQTGYEADPLAETQFNPVPGLLHKYHGRVLVMLTEACAIHCRYCFRREFPYEDNNPGKAGWQKLFEYIRQDPAISEVILSGGDPLVVNDRTLQAFSEELVKIPHIKRLRIHTRLPIVLPERITHEFLNWIGALPLQPIMVIHANHPQEIDSQVVSALIALRQRGVTLLNQTVLLAGINDDVDTLVELNESLFAVGVLPYYLHILDKVRGTAHFDMALAAAQNIHQGLLSKLPGYLVPRLVAEKPNNLSKTLMHD